MTAQDTSDSYVPYIRRRNTPTQLSALQQLFEGTPHPTRTQRQVLANEIGMELKSVTNWFQNRRQTSRKKSSFTNENKLAKIRSPPSPAHQRYKRPKTPFDRSKISLDRIATLSERPSLTLQSDSPRSALTPRKSNVQQQNPSSPSELWTHMLSSPVASPPPPDPEEIRSAALCPLERACLKARQNRWFDGDADGLPAYPALGCCQEVEDEVVSEETYLGSNAALFPSSSTSARDRKNVVFSRPDMTPQFEDVEAAITLLGFKTRV